IAGWMSSVVPTVSVPPSTASPPPADSWETAELQAPTASGTAAASASAFARRGRRKRDSARVGLGDVGMEVCLSGRAGRSGCEVRGASGATYRTEVRGGHEVRGQRERVL